METIEINGLFYERKPQKERKVSMMETTALVMAMAFGGVGLPIGGRSQNNISHINIVEEFKLIQLKKSKLSKSQRDSVVHQFYRHFSLVEKPS